MAYLDPDSALTAGMQMLKQMNANNDPTSSGATSTPAAAPDPAPVNDPFLAAGLKMYKDSQAAEAAEAATKAATSASTAANGAGNSSATSSTTSSTTAPATGLAADPSYVDYHKALPTLAEGVGHGLNAFYAPIVNAAAKLPGIAQLDQMVPEFVSNWDKKYGTAQDEAAFQAGAGKTTVGKIGNFVGQQLAVAPATLPFAAVGSGLGMLARTAPALSDFAGNALARAAVVGTGAASGATNAELTGGNPLTGAIAGGAVPLAGAAINQLGKSASAASVGIANHPWLTGLGLGALHGLGAGALTGGDPLTASMVAAFGGVAGPKLAKYATRYGGAAATALGRSLQGAVAGGVGGSSVADLLQNAQSGDQSNPLLR